MKLIWGFITVSTYYAVYIVLDKEHGVLKFVSEFNTHGHAVKWISNSGEKNVTYCIQTHLSRR